MASSKFANNWTVLKRKLKQSHAHLNDADLNYVEGREDELLTRLQRCLGKSPLELAWLIDSLAGEAARMAGPSWALLTSARWQRFPLRVQEFRRATAG